MNTNDMARRQVRIECDNQIAQNDRVKKDIAGLTDDELTRLKSEVLATLAPEIRKLYDKDPRKSLPLMLMIDKHVRART